MILIGAFLVVGVLQHSCRSVQSVRSNGFYLCVYMRRHHGGGSVKQAQPSSSSSHRVLKSAGFFLPSGNKKRDFGLFPAEVWLLGWKGQTLIFPEISDSFWRTLTCPTCGLIIAVICSRSLQEEAHRFKYLLHNHFKKPVWSLMCALGGLAPREP